MTQQDDQSDAKPAAQAALEVEKDPRYGYRAIRYNTSKREQELNQHRINTSWGHARVNSIIVCAIGNHWNPGSWQAVMDMIHYTNSHGYNCSLEEIMDRCFQPYDSLGTMRNEAIFRACQGYEWLLYVDNDVYPEPDVLVRLIERDQSIIAPYVIEPETGRPLHGPVRPRWQGLQPVRWCVLSMLLFRVNVFNATGPKPWKDSIGADEGYHFQLFWHYGHRPMLDTEITLRVANRPTYPLATLRMEKPDYDEFWQKRRDNMTAMPDRKPLNPNDPRITNGEYLPFVDIGTGEAGTTVDAGTTGTAAEVEVTTTLVPTKTKTEKALQGIAGMIKRSKC